MSLRVLMVHEPAGGGSGRQVLDLSEGLIARGHRVSLAYSGRRAETSYLKRAGAIDFEHLTVLDMHRELGPHDLGSAHALKRWMRRHGPFDVVHAHSSKAGALARLVAPRGVARVYTPHAFRTMDPELGRAPALVYGQVEGLFGALLSDAVIAVGGEEAEHAGRLGIPKAKIHLVANGVEPFQCRMRQAVREELGLGAEAIAVGFVGRLTAQKDPTRFCAAIQAAHALDSRVVGVMIGDGELAGEVRSMAAPVLHLGGQDARAYFAGFDMLAMTSRYEGFPYVLLEALQAGLPIISSEVGGASAVIESGRNGVLLDRDADPAAFAAAIVGLADAAERARYAAASRAVAPNFAADVMVTKTEHVYRTAVARRRAGRGGAPQPLPVGIRPAA